MKKIILIFVCLICSMMSAFATSSADALNFFNTYENAANTYNSDLIDYYSKNATIIRIVLRPDGTRGTAVFTMQDYAIQLKLGQATAKMRNYKNYYTNKKVTKYKDGYKITCLRQPTGEKYKLNAYFIVSNKSGRWLITEEMMETKVQIFNNYVNR